MNFSGTLARIELVLVDVAGSPTQVMRFTIVSASGTITLQAPYAEAQFQAARAVVGTSNGLNIAVTVV